MQQKEIKPCPFCGEKRILFSENPDKYISVGCILIKCGSLGPLRKTYQEAIEAWNERK